MWRFNPFSGYVYRYPRDIGEQGPAGVAGPSGSNGSNGSNGPSAYQIAQANGYSGSQNAWLASLVGATGSTGSLGSTGPKGDKGDTGSQGQTGPSGSTGASGSVGATGPAGSASTVPGPQGISGTAGTNGTNGTNGLDGQTVLNGTSAPSSGLGNNGDFYINTTTSVMYGPKTSGSWGSSTSIVGPQGIQGIPGTSITDTAGSEGNLGAITWTGTTSPLGTITKRYLWHRTGGLVTFTFTITATLPGVLVTKATFPLPVDAPIPYVLSNVPTGGIVTTGTGSLTTSLLGLTTGGMSAIVKNGASFNIECTGSAALAANSATGTIIYKAAT